MNNLLASALSIIPRVPFQVQKFDTEAINDLGYKVPVFSAQIDALGIVEAVDNATYQQLGLEFGKNYIQVWGELEMLGLDKQEIADRIIFNGKTFNVVKSTDWLFYNGWSSVIAVEDKNQ